MNRGKEGKEKKQEKKVNVIKEKLLFLKTVGKCIGKSR